MPGLMGKFMKTKDTLGVFEQLVLTAVLLCRDEAYTRKVNEKVNELGGKDVQLAAIYVVLDRLERKGFVKAWQTDPVPESGGKPRWCYGLLPDGERAMA